MNSNRHPEEAGARPQRSLPDGHDESDAAPQHHMADPFAHAYANEVHPPSYEEAQASTTGCAGDQKTMFPSVRASSSSPGNHAASSQETRQFDQRPLDPDYSYQLGASAEPTAEATTIGAAFRDTQDEPMSQSSETEGTRAFVIDDGRVEMHIDESRLISRILSTTLQAENRSQEQNPTARRSSSPSPTQGKLPSSKVVRLNIVMQVVGSRGDVQPFVALGKVLKDKYGHRVRLATHGVFRKFVTENGLEFFDMGGDPVQLMAFMVKNPGLIPGIDSIASGDVGKRQKEMKEILMGAWRSCFEAGDGTGPPLEQEGFQTSETEMPFIADAIIANPPSSGHIHIAEKLGIPLHIVFTMPWSPTLSFPHPLANIVSVTTGERRANFLSYALVEVLMWQGLGAVINRFREKTLFLDPLSDVTGPGVHRIHVRRARSPALIPKPADWENHITVSGFSFLPLSSTFTPDADLEAFLKAGPPPLYIGFGSIVPADPDGLTRLLFSAIQQTGQRALVSKGWGGLGKDDMDIPDDVFMLGNVPHEWLFERVSCVVHHGGAGTTSTGIAKGKPTIVVPFFGDQQFWGSMVARAGAGPPPIPFKQLTAENLASAILMAIEPETVEAAKVLGQKLAGENGRETAADDFHKGLDLDTIKCDLSPSRTAVWRVSKTKIKLSAFAATVLANAGILNMNNLKRYHPRSYHTVEGSVDPISGGLGAILGPVGSLMMGMIDIPLDVAKAVAVKSTSSLNDQTEGPRPAPRGHPEKPNAGSPIHADQSPAPSSIESSRLSSTTPVDAADPHELKLPRRPTNAEADPSGSEPAPPSPVRRESDNKGKKKSIKEKVTAAKARISLAFGFGFYKELSGNEHMARSSFLPDVKGSIKDHPSGSIGSDAALGAGKGLGRIAAIGMRIPMDFAMGISSGFRNAPKLYGDTTVRPAHKVEGFNSGLQAATREFGYGVYDGVTGLVSQPYNGAKKEGVSGFFKGFAKGVGGAVLKPGAALFGIPGYAFKGIHQEIQNHFGSGMESYIISVHTAKGLKEYADASEDEKTEIVNKWHSKEMEQKMSKPGIMDRWQSVQRSRRQWKEDEERESRAEN
ncbi:hypothetical protein MHUMG1_08816 [Metarhizium humberi]|uniref:CHIP6 protein n=1 Tax=Metarhizium humberi TaxID=2596975 RepID=A0A9P8M430_9HYPO|nr:hypothetical protein MHUMG1_08816 [Metarhizium humberi]